VRTGASLEETLGKIHRLQDPATDEWLRTCTIITGEANEFVRAIHTRTPLILWLVSDMYIIQSRYIHAADEVFPSCEASELGFDAQE